MKLTPVNLTQGDYIYYYDNSVGNVVSRSWDFFGGSPTGASTFGRSVRYVNQNKKGYTAQLTVTDSLGAKSIDIENNLVRVLPEIEDLRVIATRNGDPVSSSRLSDTTFYQATGSIRTAPTGSYYYEWTLPEVGPSPGIGFTGNNKNIINPPPVNANDWFTISGTYLGSFGSKSLRPARLNILSPLGNRYSAEKNIEFQKRGLYENIKNCNYEVGIFNNSNNDLEDSINISSIGLAGIGDILIIAGKTGPSSTIPNFNNSKTRVNRESLSLYTGCWDFKLDLYNTGLLKGENILNSSSVDTIFPQSSTTFVLDPAGVPWINRNNYNRAFSGSEKPSFSSSELSFGQYVLSNFYGSGGQCILFADSNSHFYNIRSEYNHLYLYGNTWNWGNENNLKTLSPLNFRFSGIQASISSASYYFSGLIPPAQYLGLTGGERGLFSNGGSSFGYGYFYDSDVPNDGRVFKMGPCLPSGKFAKSDIILYFNFYLDRSGYVDDNDLDNAESVYTVSVIVGLSGADGNSRDGNLIYCHSGSTFLKTTEAWKNNLQLSSTAIGDFGVQTGNTGGVGKAIADRFFSLGLINNTDIVYVKNDGVSDIYIPPENNPGSSDGFIRIRTSPFYYTDINQYVPFYTYNDDFQRIPNSFPLDSGNLPHGIQFSIPRVIEPISSSVAGITGPTNIVGMTITDNSDQWFPHMPNMPKFKAHEWLCLKQNFLMNPYQHERGTTGAFTGWFFEE